MRTDISFVDGGRESFDGPANVKLAEHGIEITYEEDGAVLRVLFPWNRIQRVTQSGPELASTYTF